MNCLSILDSFSRVFVNYWTGYSQIMCTYSYQHQSWNRWCNYFCKAQMYMHQTSTFSGHFHGWQKFIRRFPCIRAYMTQPPNFAMPIQKGISILCMTDPVLTMFQSILKCVCVCVCVCLISFSYLKFWQMSLSPLHHFILHQYVRL